MDSFKSLFFRLRLIHNDIYTYHSFLQQQNEHIDRWRALKNCFIPLDIFRICFKELNSIIANDKLLIEESRTLKKKLKFINHLRNRVSGHLDKEVVENAIQWEPHCFHNKVKNEEIQTTFVYKALLESAINSYQDDNLQHKIFDEEIDLALPEYERIFLDFISELNNKSLSFIDKILEVLNSKIKYWDEPEMLKMMSKAANTDFKLKS